MFGECFLAAAASGCLTDGFETSNPFLRVGEGNGLCPLFQSNWGQSQSFGDWARSSSLPQSLLPWRSWRQNMWFVAPSTRLSATWCSRWVAMACGAKRGLGNKLMTSLKKKKSPKQIVIIKRINTSGLSVLKAYHWNESLVSHPGQQNPGKKLRECLQFWLSKAHMYSQNNSQTGTRWGCSHRVVGKRSCILSWGSQACALDMGEWSLLYLKGWKRYQRKSHGGRELPPLAFCLSLCSTGACFCESWPCLCHPAAVCEEM